MRAPLSAGPPGYRLAAGLAPLFALVAVAGAEAQVEVGMDCQLESYRRLQSQELAMSQRVTHVGRPVLVCPDGSRIRADSATVYTVTNLTMFDGNFVYDSPRWLLESDAATYTEQDQRLTATGNAVLRDHADGSVIRADTLVHFGADDRSEERLTATGGRPSAVLPPPRDEEGMETEDVPPYEVQARRLEFEGERTFRAYGSVEVVREEMRASADSLRYEREEGLIVLRGEASMEGDEYDLAGETLELYAPGDRLSEVRALEEGVLNTADLVLTAPTELRILLEDERMNRLIAVRRTASAEGDEAADDGPESPEDDPDEAQEPADPPEGPGRSPGASEFSSTGPQAEATTQDFHLQGDSIDALAPEQVLESVTAVGRARGETRGRVLPGDVEETYPELARNDWIEGDAVTATFERLESADADDAVDGPDAGSAADRPYRLKQLVARGAARSLYRIEVEDGEGDAPEVPEEEPEEPDPEAAPQEAVPERRWAISYLLADEIRILMMEGEVDRMEAEGDVRGVHLEPQGRTARTAPEGAATRPGEEDGR